MKLSMPPCCKEGYIRAFKSLKTHLDINNILGCTFILIGVIFSQILPELKKTNNR